VSWRRRHQASACRGQVAGRTALAGTAALTDRLWQQIAPLLPPQKPPRGRPALDHRRLLEGLLWVMHTGVPWREMPAAYGSWHTAYSRYQHWCHTGVWDRLCAILHSTAPYQPSPAPG